MADKFQIGTIVKLIDSKDMSASYGACGKVIRAPYKNKKLGICIKVKWFRNNWEMDQQDGVYSLEKFEIEKVPVTKLEVSHLQLVDDKK